MQPRLQALLDHGTTSAHPESRGPAVGLRGGDRQAIPLGLGYVKISGGKALLRRDDVLELIELTFRLGVSTRLETNGTLLDAQVADTLQRTRTAVSISLDGSTPELHEAIRLIPGCFEQTLAALALLADGGFPWS